MNITTVSDFRKDIKTHLEKVVDNVEPLVIKRAQGKTGVVVISLDEYNALMTTQHELSSRTNEQRLDSAIDRLNNQEGQEQQLIED